MKDKKLTLQTRDGGYWISDVQHNGWEIVEEFNWQTEVFLIEWLERLIAEGKIDTGDAIRVGVYYGQR